MSKTLTITFSGGQWAAITRLSNQLGVQPLNVIKDAVRHLVVTTGPEAKAFIRDAGREGKRIEQLEATLTEVWLWTHDKHLDIELLTHILKRADNQGPLIAALDELEQRKAARQ